MLNFLRVVGTRARAEQHTFTVPHQSPYSVQSRQALGCTLSVHGPNREKCFEIGDVLRQDLFFSLSLRNK